MSKNIAAYALLAPVLVMLDSSLVTAQTLQNTTLDVGVEPTEEDGDVDEFGACRLHAVDEELASDEELDSDEELASETSATAETDASVDSPGETESGPPVAKAFVGQWRVPEIETAPQDHEAAARIQLPNGAEMQDGLMKAWEQARTGVPESGRVHCRKEGSHCKWERPDGSISHHWPSGNWEVEAGDHKLQYFADKSCGACEGTYRLSFPDGTKLDRKLNRQTNQHWFIHEDGHSGFSFSIYPKDSGTKNHRVIPPYVFAFHERWSLHLEAFAQWPGREAFFAYALRSFDMKSPRISAILHDKPSDLIRFSEESPDYTYRGNANRHRMTSHGEGLPLLADAQDPELRAWLLKRQTFDHLIHETTHNLQSTRCYQLNPKDGKNSAVPPEWFREGFAEFMAMRFAPNRRAHNHEILLDHLEKGTMPALSELNHSNDEALYPLGGVLVDYLVSQYGEASVAQYHDAVCGGTPEQEVFQEQFGRSLEEAYEAMARHFASERKTLRADIFAWRVEALPRLDHADTAQPDARIRVPLPASLRRRSPRNVPDISRAYLLDISGLQGKYEGPFRGPEGEYGYLWMSGHYQLETLEWKVSVTPNTGYTDFESSGHEIINWGDGQKQWRLPKGHRKAITPSKAKKNRSAQKTALSAND